MKKRNKKMIMGLMALVILGNTVSAVSSNADDITLKPVETVIAYDEELRDAPEFAPNAEYANRAEEPPGYAMSITPETFAGDSFCSDIKLRWWGGQVVKNAVKYDISITADKQVHLVATLNCDIDAESEIGNVDFGVLEHDLSMYYYYGKASDGYDHRSLYFDNHIISDCVDFNKGFKIDCIADHNVRMHINDTSLKKGTELFKFDFVYNDDWDDDGIVDNYTDWIRLHIFGVQVDAIMRYGVWTAARASVDEGHDVVNIDNVVLGNVKTESASTTVAVNDAVSTTLAPIIGFIPGSVETTQDATTATETTQATTVTTTVETKSTEVSTTATTVVTEAPVTEVPVTEATVVETTPIQNEETTTNISIDPYRLLCEQRLDINRDGRINAVDAALILTIAADYGAGKLSDKEVYEKYLA